jgi:ABC-type bacteriocin/lantibiotic exporter with double-glycine peptidase domain
LQCHSSFLNVKFHLLALNRAAANMTDKAPPKDIAPSIDVNNLSYAFPDGSTGLKDVFLNLPPGSRTLLIGGLAA